jgi:hypothetical protein
MGNLKRAQQPLVKQLMRRQTRDVLAAHINPARRRFKNARDHIEKRGFSCAIRPDKPGDGPLGNLERGPIDRAKSAKMLGYIVNSYHLNGPPVSILERKGSAPPLARAARFHAALISDT